MCCVQLPLSAQIPQHILPLVYRALESSPEIQQLAVNVIPTFMNTIEYSAMKNSVIPRIQACMLLWSQRIRLYVVCACLFFFALSFMMWLRLQAGSLSQCGVAICACQFSGVSGANDRRDGQVDGPGHDAAVPREGPSARARRADGDAGHLPRGWCTATLLLLWRRVSSANTALP